jgi:hypothetical protein
MQTVLLRYNLASYNRCVWQLKSSMGNIEISALKFIGSRFQKLFLRSCRVAYPLHFIADSDTSFHFKPELLLIK